MISQQYHNFLEPDVLASLRNKFESSRGKAAFEVNNMGRWGAGLEAGSYAPVLVLPLDEYKEYFVKKYSNEVDPRFRDYTSLTCFMHVWLPGSQIQWHHDDPGSNSRLSSTIYINESWNWNWGGLFIYEHPDQGQRWVYPHPNSMIWFVPPVWHATTMVNAHAPHPRLSIQCFFNRTA